MNCSIYRQGSVRPGSSIFYNGETDGKRLPYVELEWHLVTSESSASNNWSAFEKLQKLLEPLPPLQLKMLGNINAKILTETLEIFNKSNLLIPKSVISDDIWVSRKPIFCWEILLLGNVHLASLHGEINIKKIKLRENGWVSSSFSLTGAFYLMLTFVVDFS